MRMRLRTALLAVCILLAAVHVEGAEPPSLIRARTLYNAADYDGAIAAALIARQQSTPPDAAALVLGRAHLERYRLRTDVADLDAARSTLATVRAATLDARDQLDLLIGLGQSLFFSSDYGAAAELFDAALARESLLDERDRLMLLDWWASALDREAQVRPAEGRAPLFERILARMEIELRQMPWNGPANYWLAVAARGIGDVDRAWSAAIAGWVRSNLGPEPMPSLRADLDRLVIEALVPERARTRPGRDFEDTAIGLRAEWDAIKELWK
jgi:hypothetical protein